mgnify:CR=1 FL=1
MKKLALALFALLALSACKDEVGTQGWCETMDNTPKTEWNAQTAVDYAKHCVILDAVGSEAWCKQLDNTPKADWSANDAASYAKHCIF